MTIEAKKEYDSCPKWMFLKRHRLRKEWKSWLNNLKGLNDIL